MRHLLLAGMAASVASSSALALTPKLDTSNMTTIPLENISKAPIPGVSPATSATPRAQQPVVTYSALSGFLSSQTFSNVDFRVDDFQMDPGSFRNEPNANVVTDFQFVGGVENANESIQFFFLDSNGITINSFETAPLPSPGNFIWTFTPPAGTIAEDAGFFAAQAPQGSTVTWFLTDTADIGSTQTDGTNDGEFETSAFAFELRNLPGPGAAALFGLAGLAASRRRRS